MTRLLAWAPLGLAVLLGAGLSFGLARPQRGAVTTQLVGAEVPAFAAPPILPGRPGVAGADLRAGHPVLLNLFASWCVPCAAEAPQLAALARAGVPVMGLAVHDRPEPLRAFLRHNGDPYRRIGADGESRVAGGFGASGVPESFLVDGQGRVLRRWAGPIAPADVAGVLRAVAAAR